MGRMSDVTMLKRLCVADFGHAMSMLHWHLPKVWQWQVLARDKPKPRSFAASSLNHSISSILWVQWVMWICWEGSVWLILDMPCPVALFHLLHISPMNIVTMLKQLCVANFGHAMPLWRCRLSLRPKVWQVLARDKPKPRSFAASSPSSMALLNHFISSILWVP